MFTCDEAIGKDATDLFNYLTGYSTNQDYQKLARCTLKITPKTGNADPAGDCIRKSGPESALDLQNEFPG